MVCNTENLRVNICGLEIKVAISGFINGVCEREGWRLGLPLGFSNGFELGLRLGNREGWMLGTRE
jgi:hypothetical protein